MSYLGKSCFQHCKKEAKSRPQFLASPDFHLTCHKRHEVHQLAFLMKHPDGNEFNNGPFRDDHKRAPPEAPGANAPRSLQTNTGCEEFEDSFQSPPHLNNSEAAPPCLCVPPSLSANGNGRGSSVYTYLRVPGTTPCIRYLRPHGACGGETEARAASVTCPAPTHASDSPACIPSEPALTSRVRNREQLNTANISAEAELLCNGLKVCVPPKAVVETEPRVVVSGGGASGP